MYVYVALLTLVGVWSMAFMYMGVHLYVTQVTAITLQEKYVTLNSTLYNRTALNDVLNLYTRTTFFGLLTR